MPLPSAPTRKPQNSAAAQVGNELLIKGFLYMMIGLAALLSSRFISSPDIQGIVDHSSWVGWLTLALGVALADVHLRHRLTG